MLHRFVGLAMTAGLMMIAAPSAQAQGRGRNVNGVPPGHMPPPGMCRVWVDGVPPGRQPAPTDCRTARRTAPRNARVIYGGDAKYAKGKYKKHQAARYEDRDDRWDDRDVRCVDRNRAGECIRWERVASRDRDDRWDDRDVRCVDRNRAGECIRWERIDAQGRRRASDGRYDTSRGGYGIPTDTRTQPGQLPRDAQCTRRDGNGQCYEWHTSSGTWRRVMGVPMPVKN